MLKNLMNDGQIKDLDLAIKIGVGTYIVFLFMLLVLILTKAGNSEQQTLSPKTQNQQR